MRYTILLLIMAVFAAFAGGLATMSQGGIQFAVDTAVFSLGMQDTLLLEVYEELNINQLSRDEEGNSIYTTEITLESVSGDTLAWDIWNTPVTWSEGGTAVNCTMLPVLGGSWRLTVTMTDVNNGRQGTAVKEFQIDGIGHFSDIEMARTIMPAAAGSTSQLLKGSLIVYPAASTRFRLPGESMFYTYQELYGLGGMNLLRHSRLLNADGVTVFSRSAESIQIPEGVETVALLDSIDLTVVREPGLYSLSVVYTTDGDTVQVLDKPMFIEVAETVVEGVSQNLTISDRKLELLPVMLSNEEAELYERLDGESRELYYDNYWNARPGEHEGFLQRCQTVTSRFGSFNREGWQSDRGRVYLVYGEPDEVESSPFSTTQAPFTIWYYYGNQQEMFVFADLMGNGDYLQIYSTVDGEISYSNWQGMIQNVNSGSGSSDDGEF